MPLRDYECPECGNEQEEFFRTQTDYTDRREGIRCNKCNQLMRPMPSKTAEPQFKGHGFYKTDYQKRG